MWTAVPNGIGGTAANPTLNVSVFVAPTLSGGATGTLEDFPDFQDWPATITPHAGQAATGFAARFSNVGGTPLAQERVSIPTTVLNSSLWQELFNPPGTSPPGSTVQYSARDAAEPYTDVPIVSYPTGAVTTFLKNTYTTLVKDSPAAYPPLQTLQGVYGRNAYVNPDGIDRLDSIYAGLRSGRSASPFANDWSGVTATDALAALRFYHLPPLRFNPGYAPFPRPTIAELISYVDFHRALTFIGDHGVLQRALGLVFDLVIPVPQFVTSSINTNVYVQVWPANVDGTASFTPSAGVTYKPVFPRTQCDISSSVFQAHASSSQIVDRMLTLGDTSSFMVTEVDIDGGGLKNSSFADSLTLSSDPQRTPLGHDFAPQRAPDAPAAYAPPALRSAGLTVTALNRAFSLFGPRVQRNGRLVDGSVALDLTAEDLVRGYLLDVYDQTQNVAWRSTAMRDVSYTAGAVNLTVNADEASTDAPPRSQTDPGNASQQQLNLSEIILRWNGWSNAAPRPGSPLQDDGTTTPPSGSQDGPFSQLTITANVTPGSLPELRYGHTYAVRARVVDIANNALSLNQASADGANIGDAQGRVSPTLLFTRHEPVGSPDVYNPHPTPLTGGNPVPGEVLKRLVVRDIDPASSVRYFAPNPVSESFSELHGEFDTASGPPDPTAYATIIARDQQLFDTTAVLTKSVPYMPDPLSRGGVLRIITGTLAGKFRPFAFETPTGWPKYEPFGLQLLAGAGQTATVNNSTRLVEFTLGKADVVTIQLSSLFAPGDLPTMGIYQWVAEAGPVPTLFKDAALAGFCWALTPYTTLQLVYAVRRPLFAPTLQSFSPLRELGWTYAQLFGDITYSPKSTSKTDLRGTWGEPVDNGPGSGAPQGPGAPDTTLAPREATAFTIPSKQNDNVKETDRFQGKHEFHDTKHRRVTYQGHATSRFTEFFTGQTTINSVPAVGVPFDLRLPGSPNLGIEPGSVTVTNKDGTKTYVEDTDYKISSTTGRITFLAGGPAPGSTVEVSWLPIVGRDTPLYPLNILSSARPGSLAVPFIVPIYKWAPITKAGSKTRSGRSPSALRVFLERPWWTSGIDELLGVVTWPDAELQIRGFPPPLNIPDIESPYVSDWGADPVFGGPALPSKHPRLASFLNRVAVGKGLTIEEKPGIVVNVAGHPVSFAPDQDLWYADIRVETGQAYTPMIRLALARYQPQSIANAELGRIVLADVMSLEPGRAVVVYRGGPGFVSKVTLVGYSYTQAGDASQTAPGYARVTLERRNQLIHDDLIGWEPVGRPMTMRATSGPGGVTIWSSNGIQIPPGGGKYRLSIEQYEILPTDQRSNAVTIEGLPSQGLRLLYQDQIPL
jgi:hypothetical protein